MLSTHLPMLTISICHLFCHRNIFILWTTMQNGQRKTAQERSLWTLLQFVVNFASIATPWGREIEWSKKNAWWVAWNLLTIGKNYVEIVFNSIELEHSKIYFSELEEVRFKSCTLCKSGKYNYVRRYKKLHSMSTKKWLIGEPKKIKFPVVQEQ